MDPLSKRNLGKYHVVEISVCCHGDVPCFPCTLNIIALLRKRSPSGLRVGALPCSVPLVGPVHQGLLLEFNCAHRFPSPPCMGSACRGSQLSLQPSYGALHVAAIQVGNLDKPHVCNAASAESQVECAHCPLGPNWLSLLLCVGCCRSLLASFGLGAHLPLCVTTLN